MTIVETKQPIRSREIYFFGAQSIRELLLVQRQQGYSRERGFSSMDVYNKVKGDRVYKHFTLTY